MSRENPICSKCGVGLDSAFGCACDRMPKKQSDYPINGTMNALNAKIASLQSQLAEARRENEILTLQRDTWIETAANDQRENREYEEAIIVLWRHRLGECPLDMNDPAVARALARRETT